MIILNANLFCSKIVNITPIEVEKELKKEEKYTNSLKVVV